MSFHLVDAGQYMSHIQSVLSEAEPEASNAIQHARELWEDGDHVGALEHAIEAVNAGAERARSIGKNA